MGSFPFKLLLSRKLWGVLHLIKKNWDRRQSPRKQGQKCQQCLHNTVARLRQFSSVDNFFLLLLLFSAKAFAKWQGPIMGNIDYEVVQSDKGGPTQI